MAIKQFLKGIIHYGILPENRNLKIKPYRKIVIRILKDFESQFRQLLNINPHQVFSYETKRNGTKPYKWDEGCPEYDNTNNKYNINPNCEFIFYTKKLYDDFIAKCNFVISDKAKTFWYPNPPEKEATVDGFYTTAGDCDNQYPIYIPTYKRHNTCYTAISLEKLGIKSYHLVIRNTAEEITNYTNAIEKFKLTHAILLPIDDDFYKDQEEQGNGYSIIPRNFAYQHAINANYTHHWIIDDNIKGFYMKNKGVILPFENTCYPLVFVEEYMKQYSSLAQCAIQYKHLGFSSSDRNIIILNSRCYSCILLKHINGYRWRGKYNEDTDLSLRLLKDGYATMTFQNILCDKQCTSSVRGGNTDAFHKSETGYDNKAESLIAQHPDVTKKIIKYSRVHHQVNYTPFKNNDLLETGYKLNDMPGIIFIEN